MLSVPFNAQGKGALELPPLHHRRHHYQQEPGLALPKSEAAREESFNFSCAGAGHEPTSVLDHRRSPSPPNSSSTLSSSIGGSAAGHPGAADVSALSPKWGLSSELAPMPPALDMGLAGAGSEDWGAMLGDPPAQESTFLRWIMDENSDRNLVPDPPAPLVDHPPVDLGFGFVDPLSFGQIGPCPVSSSINPPQLGGDGIGGSHNAAGFTSGFGLLSPELFSDTMDTKPGLNCALSSSFSAGQLLLHQQQQQHAAPIQTLFIPSSTAPPLISPAQSGTKRHHHLIPAVSAPELQFQNQLTPLLPQGASFVRPVKKLSMMTSGDQMSPAASTLLELLMDAARFAEFGNASGACGILARLNHQLPGPFGKPPFLRSAFYLKEALQRALSSNTDPGTRPSPVLSPADVPLKLGAYKAFADLSPTLQFANFTATQAILEELSFSNCIHIIDFDIGVGGQWSSFMQELAHRFSGNTDGTIPMLKITAFVAPSSHHPLELHLTQENLVGFAAELHIPFEFNILSIDSFDPSAIRSSADGSEEIAVSLPVGFTAAVVPSFSVLLHLLKQLNPKIVVSIDHGCDRTDLPFAQYFFHMFQSFMFLLDSIDSAGANADVVHKIEHFLLQPRVDNAVMMQYRGVEKMLPWYSAFAAAGFLPVQLSNFAEAQADCLLKRVQVRGFHVDRSQSSLGLYWQRGELISVSAWKC